MTDDDDDDNKKDENDMNTWDFHVVHRREGMIPGHRTHTVYRPNLSSNHSLTQQLQTRVKAS